MGERPCSRFCHADGCGTAALIPDVALECVLNYVDDPRDRDAFSLVCRQWYRADCVSRKGVTVAFCYSASPSRLRTRFPRLESLCLKGKPRAAMFNLIPPEWGAYATPWISEISGRCFRGGVASPGFDCLKALHLRRMVVSDDDIAMLVTARAHALKILKLDTCSGFSTDGLKSIARSCRCLRTLFLEESSIAACDTEWLHELAVNNSVLETLNFHMTYLAVLPEDLELLARNCRSLVSLKISDCDLSQLILFFQEARKLEEFSGGSFDTEQESGAYKIQFPPNLRCLGLTFMRRDDMPLIFPFCATLIKLDLQCTILGTEDHCQLLEQCPNMEILEVTHVIGDGGLEVVARACKKLRRLRIEWGHDDRGPEEYGKVTHVGLSAIATGCPQLEYMAAYVSNLTNAALESFGAYSKNLRDFRIVLLDDEESIADLPLDNGVRALLRGCDKLDRFSFYLRPGALSDAGLGYIGEYSKNIRYMLLGSVGETDHGLELFAAGCRRLQKLELRACCFSECALARAVLSLQSLRYLWVQGYSNTAAGCDLLAMSRPYWNIEFFSHELGPAQVLAYYSFEGKREDCPTYVRFMSSPSFSTTTTTIRCCSMSSYVEI